MKEEIFWPILQKITDISPLLLWAILIFLFGFLFSKFIERIVAISLRRIHLDQLFKRMGWEEALNKINPKLSASEFFGIVVRWFFIIIFLWIAARIMGLEQIGQSLVKIIFYFPNIFIASFIFITAVFLADFSQKIVVGTLEKEKIIYSDFLGKLIRWSIWFFAILAIFYQLKIVPNLIMIIFIGMVVAISLAIGISLGLGGKDLAKKILEEIAGKFK